jgi:hypothetical protein
MPTVRDIESMTLLDDPSHIGAARKLDARTEEWKAAAAAEMGSSGVPYSEKLKNVAAVPAEYGKKQTSTVYGKVAGGTEARTGKQNEHVESMPCRKPAPQNIIPTNIINI